MRKIFSTSQVTLFRPLGTARVFNIKGSFGIVNFPNGTSKAISPDSPFPAVHWASPPLRSYHMSITRKTSLPLSLNSGVRLDILLIILLSLLTVSPILVSPHFGMFSDYGQILLWAKNCVDKPADSFRQLHPLDDGRW